MSETFEAGKVAEGVYWVGAIDWTVRNFHGYLTSRGTTYNAYLILDEKVTLIDTVKAPFAEEMFARIASVADPKDIVQIVSNHSEMDHSGCLPQAIEAIRPARVVASKMGQRALEEHFGLGERVEAVGDGDELSTGKGKLSFVETRMCHWPDSMISYYAPARLLFSQDAFGMHLASSERFADELDRRLLEREEAKYYANILLHLGRSVSTALEKLDQSGWELDIVAPDHGPIFRRSEDIAWVVSSYGRWVRQEKVNKAVVLFDTMWQSTAKMAQAVGEGLAAGGTSVKLISAEHGHRSDVATELLDAGALVVGSPTLNNTIFPTLADVLTYLKGLRPANLVGAVFGSYGWSGEATKELAATLEEMHVEMVSEPLKVKYVPTAEDLAACRKLGAAVAAALARKLS